MSRRARIPVRPEKSDIVGVNFVDKDFSVTYEPTLGHVIQIAFVDPTEKNAFGTVVKVTPHLVTVVRHSTGITGSSRTKTVCDREEIKTISRLVSN